MRYILLITALTVAMRSNCIEPSKQPTLLTIGVNVLFFGGIGYCVFDYVNGNNPNDMNRQGMYISLGADPKMAFVEKSPDIIMELGYTINRVSAYISTESFDVIDFKYNGFGLDYAIIDKKMSLHVGVEAGEIDRPYGSFNSIGLNVKTSLNINKKIGMALKSNIKTRGDITKKYIASNYVSVNWFFGQK